MSIKEFLSLKESSDFPNSPIGIPSSSPLALSDAVQDITKHFVPGTPQPHQQSGSQGGQVAKPAPHVPPVTPRPAKPRKTSRLMTLLNDSLPAPAVPKSVNP